MVKISSFGLLKKFPKLFSTKNFLNTGFFNTNLFQHKSFFSSIFFFTIHFFTHIFLGSEFYFILFFFWGGAKFFQAPNIFTKIILDPHYFPTQIFFRQIFSHQILISNLTAIPYQYSACVQFAHAAYELTLLTTLIKKS